MCKKVKLRDFQKGLLYDFYMEEVPKMHKVSYWSGLKEHCEVQIRELSALDSKKETIYNYIRYYNSLRKLCDLKLMEGGIR